MVNIALRQAWRKEGIPAPADRCVESWRCPVCGAPPDFLEEVNNKIPEAIRCGICAFPFSLPVLHRNKSSRLVPLPAHDDKWLLPWTFVYSTLKKPDATEGVMETVLHPSYIEVTPEFAAKFKQQKGGQSAKMQA